MLTSEYRHTLDAKNRLFIPAKHREELGKSFMVFRSIRGNCLKVYSMEEWTKYIAPFETLPRATAEKLNRFINRFAIQVEPDAQGRIGLNEGLIQHAMLEKEAVIVGCGHYSEIWSAKLYEAEVEAESQEEIRAQLEEVGL